MMKLPFAESRQSAYYITVLGTPFMEALFMEEVTLSTQVQGCKVVQVHPT